MLKRIFHSKSGTPSRARVRATISVNAARNSKQFIGDVRFDVEHRASLLWVGWAILGHHRSRIPLTTNRKPDGVKGCTQIR